jgi:hypothetical protein
MDKTYVFCRYWSFFTPQFPFDQFNDLAEDQLEAELRAVVEREGPSDEAIKEWLADSWQQTLRGSVERGTPRRSRSSAPKQELPPKLREWLERRAKQGAATHTTQGTQASQRDNVLLVHKLRYMGWLRWQMLWNWGFLKRHILVVAPTQDMAAEVAKALAQRYQSDPGCPRFGTVAAETVPVSQQLLFDQEADQRRAAAMNPLDKTGLADVARCAIDLLNRLLSPGQAQPAQAGGRAPVRFFRYFRKMEEQFENDPLAQANLAAMRHIYERLVDPKPLLPGQNEVQRRLSELATASGSPEAQKVASIAGCLLSVERTSLLLKVYGELAKTPPFSDTLQDAGQGKTPDGNIVLYLLWLLEDWADAWHALDRAYHQLAQAARDYSDDPRPFLSASEYAAAQKEATLKAADNGRTSVDLFRVNGNSLYVETEAARLRLLEHLQVALSRGMASQPAQPPKVLAGKEGRRKHVQERYQQLAQEQDSSGNPVYPSQEKIIKKLVEEEVGSRNTILADIQWLRNQKHLPPRPSRKSKEVTNRMHHINPTRPDAK